MNFNNFLFTLSLSITFLLNERISAQDVMIFKNGDELNVKVTEISADQIRYQKWDNLSGPMYVSSKSEVFMIKYQNGTKEVFNQNSTPPPTPNTTNTDAVIELARKHMAKVIREESGGALSMIEFRKENGIQQNVFGQQTYELQYALVIETLVDIWKHSAGLFESEWFWDSYGVQSGKADIYAETFQNIQSKLFPTGSRIQITGTIAFMLTDNGWIPSGINSFSNGYDNKSSRDLRLGGGAPNTNMKAQNTTSPSTQASPNDSPITKDTYTGEMHEGKRNGQGRMQYIIGDVYEGHWVNNTIDGYGKMVYQNGQLYEGEWSKGNKQGKGKMTYTNESIYIGEWSNNIRNGQGKQVYKDSSSYEGGWKDGQFEGLATTRDNMGSYVGNFSKNKKHGQGIIYDNQGVKLCELNYVHGQLSGYNLYIVENLMERVSIEGIWEDGNINGKGTYARLDKATNTRTTFSGVFKNTEMQDGIIVKEYENGSKEETAVVNGKKGKTKKI